MCADSLLHHSDVSSTLQLVANVYAILRRISSFAVNRRDGKVLPGRHPSD